MFNGAKVQAIPQSAVTKIDVFPTPITETAKKVTNPLIGVRRATRPVTIFAYE